MRRVRARGTGLIFDPAPIQNLTKVGPAATTDIACMMGMGIERPLLFLHYIARMAPYKGSLWV